jgi:hypothetical protein
LSTILGRNLPIEHASGAMWKASSDDDDITFSADPFKGRVCFFTFACNVHLVTVMDYLLPPSDEK